MSEFADVDCRDHGCCMYGENSHPRKKDLEQGVRVIIDGKEVLDKIKTDLKDSVPKAIYDRLSTEVRDIVKNMPQSTPAFVSGCGVAGPSDGCFTDIRPHYDWHPGIVYPMHNPDWDQLENNRKSIEDYLKNHQPSYVHYDGGMTYYPASSFEPTQEDYDELNKLDLPAPNGRRPTWDDYFMGLAFIASQRSPDRSTKHGCVIVHENRVIGTGYNGFAPGADDDRLATAAPKPYHLIVHGERNAVNNCVVNPKVLRGVTAYVTGQCCGDCAEYLAQNGILTWVMANRRGFSNPTAECQGLFEKVVRDYGVFIVRTTPNLDWLVSDTFLNDLRSQGFLSS